MNPVHRFVSLPLWVIMLVLLLRKPMGVITPDDYDGWFEVYRFLVKSIRLVGRNRFEHWLITQVVEWVERERLALSELEMSGVVMVEVK